MFSDKINWKHKKNWLIFFQNDSWFVRSAFKIVQKQPKLEIFKTPEFNLRIRC